MHAEFISPDDPRWQRYLESNWHDFYHLPEYVKLCAYHEGGIPMAFYAQYRGASFLAPLIIRPLPESLNASPGWCDCVSPYGYSTPLVAPTQEQLPAFIEAFSALAKERSIVSAFFRLHPFSELNKGDLCRFGQLVHHGPTIYLDLSLTQDEFWKQVRRNHKQNYQRLVQDGFDVSVDDWARLDRFLVLGSEGGSYYIAEKALTLEGAQAVLRCLAADGPRVVARTAEVSEAGRAPKNDPAIFVLAMAAKLGDEATRKAAYAALPRICRIGTHLMHFAEYAQGFGGWGRGMRKAVASWFNARPADELALQLVKYQARDGWSTRDLLRLAHPRAASPSHDRLFAWVTSGALRPLHVDGVAGRVRLPHRIDAEAFAGVPIAPGAESRSWDWVAGGRVGRRLGDWGGAGLALLERRDAGRLAVRELGLDGSAAIGRHDVRGKVALDLIDGGLPAAALAELAAATRRGAVRGEVFTTYRSPSHLVPATSLFSVLGDVPSVHGGVRGTWRAAPRLDVGGDAGLRVLDGAVAEQVSARATLRLDDRGRGAVIAELRRAGALDGGWTGARVAGRVPLAGAWRLASELELVVPDEDRGRGRLWPWAMAAAAWSRGPWDAAVAIEASASAEERGRLDALCRVSRRWEAP